MKQMIRVVIVAARRTPFGRFGGQLARLSPAALAGAATTAALEGLNPQAIDQVILGQVLAAGQGMNVARQVAVHSGLPLTTPAVTINMMCGSGLQAAAMAVQAIRAGEARCVLAGGVESMSQAPLLLPRPPKGQSPDVAGAVDSLQRDGLVDSFSQRHMAETVEDLAHELQVSREQQDAFAERSQRLYVEAARAGRFADELVAVGELDADEHPRPEVTRASLAQLRTVFREAGTVTAGNSSGINDGAAMLVLAEAGFARQQGWPVLAEWQHSCVVGCDPQRMGLGPVHAIRALLRRTGRSPGDLDLLEINEAFAAQTLACVSELELTLDLSRVTPICRTRDGGVLALNPQGGAIALGHPLAASGARLLTHVAWELHRRHARHAVVSLCVGGGMGIAAMLSAADR